MKKFYEIDQNNTGGSFDVDDKLCHRLFIEADSEDDAIRKAESLGCYWDGVSKGIDCPCCGDRWYPCANEINLQKYVEEGYYIGEYNIGGKVESEKLWFAKYGNLKRKAEPVWTKPYSVESFGTNVFFYNIVEYAQYLSNEYGWTKPDCRIYYADGKVTEIFTKNE